MATELGALYYKITGDISELKKSVDVAKQTVASLAKEKISVEKQLANLSNTRLNNEIKYQKLLKATQEATNSMSKDQRAAAESLAKLKELTAKKEAIEATSRRKNAEMYANAALTAEKRLTEQKKQENLESKATLAVEKALTEQKKQEHLENMDSLATEKFTYQQVKDEERKQEKLLAAEKKRLAAEERARIKETNRVALEAARQAAAEEQALAKKRLATQRTLNNLLHMGLAYFSVRKVTQFYKTIVKSSSDAVEATNKLTAVFTELKQEALSTASSLAGAYGVSKTEAQDMIASTGNLLTNFGVSQKVALSMSNTIAQLGVDLASFTNFSEGSAAASYALTKTLIGEREAAKQLGVAILEADIKSMGKLYDIDTENMDRQTRALLTMEVLLKQTANAQGDFARTQMQLANKTRVLHAAFEDLKVSLGNEFLPLAIDLTGTLTNILRNVAEADPLFKKLIVTLPTLAAIISAINLVMQAGLGKIGLLITGITALLAAVANWSGVVNKTIKDSRDIVSASNKAVNAYRELQYAIEDVAKAQEAYNKIKTAETRNKLEQANAEQINAFYSMRNALLTLNSTYDASTKHINDLNEQKKDLLVTDNQLYEYLAYEEDADENKIYYNRQKVKDYMDELRVKKELTDEEERALRVYDEEIGGTDNSAILFTYQKKVQQDLANTTKELTDETTNLSTALDTIANYLMINQAAYNQLLAVQGKSQEELDDLTVTDNMFASLQPTVIQAILDRVEALKKQIAQEKTTKQTLEEMQALMVDWAAKIENVNSKIKDLADSELEDNKMFSTLQSNKIAELENEKKTYQTLLQAKLTAMAKEAREKNKNIEDDEEYQKLEEALANSNIYYEKEEAFWTKYYTAEKEQAHAEYIAAVIEMENSLHTDRESRREQEKQEARKHYSELLALAYADAMNEGKIPKKYQSTTRLFSTFVKSPFSDINMILDLLEKVKEKGGTWVDDFVTILSDFQAALKGIDDAFTDEFAADEQEWQNKIDSLGENTLKKQLDANEKEKAIALKALGEKYKIDSDEYKTLEELLTTYFADRATKIKNSYENEQNIALKALQDEYDAMIMTEEQLWKKEYDARLANLNDQFEKQLITQEEYNTQKALLDKIDEEKGKQAHKRLFDDKMASLVDEYKRKSQTTLQLLEENFLKEQEVIKQNARDGKITITEAFALLVQLQKIYNFDVQKENEKAQDKEKAALKQHLADLLEIEDSFNKTRASQRDQDKRATMQKYAEYLTNTTNAFSTIITAEGKNELDSYIEKLSTGDASVIELLNNFAKREAFRTTAFGKDMNDIIANLKKALKGIDDAFTEEFTTDKQEWENKILSLGENTVEKQKKVLENEKTALLKALEEKYGIESEQYKNLKKLLEDYYEERENIINKNHEDEQKAALKALQDEYDSMTMTEKQLQEKEHNDELNELDDKLKKQLITQEEYNAQKALLNKIYDKKVEQTTKEAQDKEKAALKQYYNDLLEIEDSFNKDRASQRDQDKRATMQKYASYLTDAMNTVSPEDFSETAKAELSALIEELATGNKGAIAQLNNFGAKSIGVGTEFSEKIVDIMLRLQQALKGIDDAFSKDYKSSIQEWENQITELGENTLANQITMLNNEEQIAKNAAAELYKTNSDEYKKLEELIEKVFKLKREKAEKDQKDEETAALKALQDEYDSMTMTEKQLREKRYTEELKALDEKHKKMLISDEAYEKQRQQMITNYNEKEKLEAKKNTEEVIKWAIDRFSQLGDLLADSLDRQIDAYKNMIDEYSDINDKLTNELSDNNNKLTQEQKDDYNRRIELNKKYMEEQEELMKEKQEEQFKINKAFAIVEATISGFQAAVSSYESGAKVGGPVLGSIMAAISAAFTGAQIALISSQPMPSYAVGAWDIEHDEKAQLHAGEMVIPKTFAQSIRENVNKDSTDNIIVNIYTNSDTSADEIAVEQHDNNLDVVIGAVRGMVATGKLDAVLQNRFLLNRRGTRN